MGATLEQVLFTLIRRIRRNYLLVRTLAALTFFLYVALVVLTLAFFQWPAAAITVGMTLTTLALVRWRRSLLYLPSETEAARILDECLASKNRAAAYLDLKRSDEDLKSEPLRSEKCALLEKQLSARLSGFDLEAAAPFKIPLILQRLLYTLPLVIVALLFLIFHLLPADRNAPNLIEAEKIAHLIQTNPLLPEGLKQELRTLASALSSHALSSSEVSKALERAQAELAESQRQLSEDTGTELEKTTEEPVQPTPSPPFTTEPTPTPEVKPQEQEQQEKTEASKDSEKNPKEGQQGDGGESQSEQSKDEQDGGKEGEGQGEGEGGGSNEQKGQAAGEQEGKGQSESGTGSQSQEEGEGNQDRRQGSPGDGDKEEEQAKQGQQKGEEGSKEEGLSKVEESLNQLNQKIEQDQKQKQHDSQEGLDQNESLAPGGAQGKEEKPDAEEKAKAKESSGEKEPEDGAGKTKDPKSQSSGEEHPNSERERQAQESQGEAPSASEIKGVLFREDGEPSEGLKGEKEFQEVKVPGQDEKYDSRFSGDQVSLQKGEGGSDYRVELKDLELAKPETVQGRVRQPIPLEYKDLLE